MTIPASFLSAILPSTLPAVQQTAKSLADKATQAFGEWFQSPQETVNGHSVPTTDSTTEIEAFLSDPSESRSGPALRTVGQAGPTALQEKLVQWLRSFASQMGLGDKQLPVTLIADGVGIPQVEGPENLANSLRESLLSQPELIEAINQSARQELESDPLKWMPGYEPRVRMPISNRSSS